MLRNKKNYADADDYARPLMVHYLGNGKPLEVQPTIPLKLEKPKTELIKI